MRIGVSLTSSFTATEGRAGARMMIERAAAARRAGLTSLFVGDHHATPGPYYQNVPILARCLAEWGEAPFGALFLLPLWNPVLLAEQVGTLATLAPGRFILQTGLGDGEDQFAAMGARVKARVSAFEESIDLVRRLLRGEVVSSSGRFQFRDGRVTPRPAEPVEFWIGGTAEPAIDRAARVGDAWLAAPGLTPKQASALVTYYRDRCRAHGKTPSTIAIRRDIYVGESDAEAEAVGGEV
jgi:alkanesulfonate monooxygenase SsuD/methylene tetrahydromethanopterin reductase-like flavin-dependent oxidoreductase (luciferase family)